MYAFGHTSGTDSSFPLSSVLYKFRAITSRHLSKTNDFWYCPACGACIEVDVAIGKRHWSMICGGDLETWKGRSESTRAGCYCYMPREEFADYRGMSWRGTSTQYTSSFFSHRFLLLYASDSQPYTLKKPQVIKKQGNFFIQITR